MNPLLFGTRERRLFGIHLPAAGGRKRRGAVLCAPWGQEYQRTHRAYRQLGERLAALGYDVLRFDYFGTGDSAGESQDVTLGGCVQDSLHAIEELCALGELQRVLLIGLRLGGAIAHRTSLEARAVDGLVMWDPVVDGRAYLQTMGVQESRALDGTSTRHVGGIPLPDAFRAELDALTPDSFLAGRSARALLVTSEPRPDLDSIALRLREGGMRVTSETHPGPPAWVEEAALGVGALPVQILDSIVQWETASQGVR